jgi:hypothetical protein
MSLAYLPVLEKVGCWSISVSVSGVTSSYSLASARPTSASPQRSSATIDPQQNNVASKTDGPLLGHVHVLSSIQTTLPNGKSLSVFRFDLGGNGLAASTVVPSEADRLEDQQMMSAFNQLTAYFNYQPQSGDIKLEGTAAIDLSV